MAFQRSLRSLCSQLADVSRAVDRGLVLEAAEDSLPRRGLLSELRSFAHPEMSDTRFEIVRALAEALVQGFHQDAESAASAHQEAIATSLETSAADMGFLTAAVSLWLVSSGTSIHINMLCEALTPNWGSWQLVQEVCGCISPLRYLSADNGGPGSIGPPIPSLQGGVVCVTCAVCHATHAPYTLLVCRCWRTWRPQLPRARRSWTCKLSASLGSLMHISHRLCKAVLAVLVVIAYTS